MNEIITKEMEQEEDTYAYHKPSGSNAIGLYNRFENPMDAIDKMGEWLAKSGLFSCETVERGKVIAMTCMADGITPLQFARNYHIINGQITMKAEAMLAELVRRKGAYKIISRDASTASVAFTFEGNEYTSTVKWDQIKDEPYTKDRSMKYKPVYASERGRMQMLWARAVSDGIRVICPQINTGALTPEEAWDYMPDNAAEASGSKEMKMPTAKSAPATKPANVVAVNAVITPAPKPVIVPQPPAAVVTPPPVVVATPKPAPPAEQPVINVESEQVSSAPVEDAPPFEPDQTPTGKMAKIAKLEELFPSAEEQTEVVEMCIKYKWLKPDQTIGMLEENILDRILQSPEGVRHTIAKIREAKGAQ